jgi:formylmethanofuran dehydrogenase subunit E
VLAGSQKTPFFLDYRAKGVPASKVPPEIVDPLIERIMGIPENELLAVGDVFDRPWTQPKPVFQSFVCELCGEMTVETYGRALGDRRVCIPCAQAASTPGA